MKILIIGGTKFLGRHLLNAVLKSGHEVVLFNRGRQYADEKLADVEQIHGDRHVDLHKLADHRFDAVIDTCGYLPATLKQSAEFFADRADRYVFISSGSVYSEVKNPNYDEQTPTAVLDEAQKKAVEQIDPKGELNGLTLGESYGALKALCEQEAEKAMPARVVNIRAGMIVGAFDWTDRFSYWVMRTARGGRVLAPGNPANPVQMIDACDLSEWIVRLIENRESGIFNATGQPFELSFGQMLDEIKTALQTNAEFVWADENFLDENNVAPWSEMPFYLPESDENMRYFLTMNVDRAVSKGLTFRPFGEIVCDLYAWRNAQDSVLRAGISADRENELLQKLRRRKENQ